MPVKKYDDAAIQTITNLDHIRARPKAYINSRGTPGIIHATWEYIGNSLDELAQRPEGGTLYVCLFRDHTRNRFQLLVKDDGRGIPASKVAKSVTTIGTSGKFSTGGAYVASGGQLGMGAKVAAALSNRYRIISKNYLENSVASVSLADGKIVDTSTARMTIPSGVTTIFELDVGTYFEEATDFMESGYLDLVELCKQLNVFNENIRFVFYVYDRKITETFWSAPLPEAIAILDDFIFHKKKDVIYDGEKVADKSSYLIDELWKPSTPVIFHDIFKKVATEAADRLKKFEVRLFITRKSTTGNPLFFCAVNNVGLPDKSGNDASVVVLSALRKKLSELQETPEYKTFVLESYRIPVMLVAIDIRYDGAELSGVTKDSFHDATFTKQFKLELNSIFRAKGDEYWKKFAELLENDIRLRYSQMYEAPVNKAGNRRLAMDLNFTSNYMECKSFDDRSELYIVEGTSAGNIKGTRDNEFQALYMTRGKPYNAATSFDQIVANRKRLMRDPIYQDLMKILNVGPNTTDMSAARFKKIVIATDADPDGYHIAALHLNNLYILNPRIIESGMVWIAKPPLYSMEIDKKHHLFLRDKIALYDARVQFLYKPTLSIRIKTPAGIITPDDNTFREMCYLVNYLGEQFELQARQLLRGDGKRGVPLLILERFVFAINYLYPTIDYNNLAKCFESSEPGLTRVQVNPGGQFIIVSIGHEDYVIGVESIGRAIVDHLLPLVKKYHYDELEFLVTSNYEGSLFRKETPMSAMMLFLCFQQLNDRFAIKRYKGLGEMPKESCFSTIMDPNTRSITQVTSVGDPAFNYDLLGTKSDTRKQLLTGSTALSNTFIRENSLL